ncbi:MAG: NAD(P)/FAD-dependent oxidoreductase [Gammaproteobacteria bacterium]
MVSAVIPDIVVIGGGVAGLSCAAALGDRARVTVVEAELQPGYHASGRSAAVYIEPYINATVHALTVASLPYHQATGARPIGDFMIADAAHADLLDAYLARWQPLCPTLREADPEALRRQVPILRPAAVARVVEDPRTLALDVHGLQDGYRRRLLAAGGRLLCPARVIGLKRHRGRWHITLDPSGLTLQADVIVNAAGAWGDAVGVLAGARPLGLMPLRRTAVLLDPGLDVRGWPMVHRIEGGLYFKPEGGVLMASLADETESAPCDAQPDELDLARLIDRFESVTTVVVRRPGRAWAGLRTFLPDQLPAVGFDPEVPGLFWLVGQGGFGMQTSPALSALAATVLLSGDHPLAAALSPRRLAGAVA